MSLLFLQLLLCTKNKFLATSTLISLSMKAGLSECIQAETFKSTTCRSQLFHDQETVLCICLA